MATVHPTSSVAPLVRDGVQQEALQVKLDNINKRAQTPVVVKYKIELLMVGTRSMYSPVRGAITLWENGGKLHGGGDGSICLCPGKALGVSQCEMPIPSRDNVAGRIVCPHCRTLWRSAQANNMLIANLPVKKWAEVLYKYYRMLDHNADIYLKHAASDIRSTYQKDIEKHANGQLMMMAEYDVKLHIYPFVNIIKDTAAGADVLGRFQAFLLS